MSHWYLEGRLAQEHRADLDREADRAAMTEQVRAGERATPRRGTFDAVFRLAALLRRWSPRIADRVDRRLAKLERDA